MTVQDVWKLVQQRGPTAVLIDRYGKTMPFAQAKKSEVEMRVGIGDYVGSQDWDILLMRGDGYSLAASFYLAHYAKALHEKEWVGEMQRGWKEPRALNLP